jgi:hypothetical protein
MNQPNPDVDPKAKPMPNQGPDLTAAEHVENFRALVDGAAKDDVGRRVVFIYIGAIGRDLTVDSHAAAEPVTRTVGAGCAPAEAVIAIYRTVLRLATGRLLRQNVVRRLGLAILALAGDAPIRGARPEEIN